TEHVAERDERQQRIAHLHQARLTLYFVHLPRLRPQRLAYRRRRHHEPLLADADDQSVEHRKSERQLDLEGGARAALARDGNAAAQRVDVAADDVHADAAPGDLGHL